MTLGISPAKVEPIFWTTPDGMCIMNGLVDKFGPDLQVRICEFAVKQILEERDGYKTGHFAFVFTRILMICESLSTQIGKTIYPPKKDTLHVLIKACNGGTYLDLIKASNALNHNNMEKS